MNEDNHKPVDIFEASEAHRIRMRNIKAANDMIDLEPDPTLRTVETNEENSLREEKPKTDYERFLDECKAADGLRCRLEDAIELLKEALDRHVAERDQG